MSLLRVEILCRLVWLAQLVPGSATSASGTGQRRVPAENDRIVKHLDFDERKLGNLESIPMHWVRHQGEGFPPYARGRFDHEVGCEAPPSFYLALDGRSCAYHYTALDIAVVPESDYRVVARVRTDGLEYARAYISAYLLDANGERLEGTEQRSQLLGGAPTSQQWAEVSVRLRGNVEAACSIGLTLWAVQRAQWRSGEEEIKHIDLKDVHGGAWFDDIIVYRLPSIELTSDAIQRGNFYRVDEPATLLVRVADSDQSGLQAQLVVHGMDGRVAHEELIQPTSQTAGGLHRRELRGLAPGVYHAQLTVAMEQGVSIDRHISFAVLSLPLAPTSGLKSRFGVLLNHEPAGHWEASSALLDVLAMGNAKLPLYRPGSPEGRTDIAQLDAFIRKHADQNVQLTGIFSGAMFAQRDPKDWRPRSLIDVFSSPAENWRPAVADVVTRYEGLLQNWQIGLDGQTDVVEDARLPLVLAGLRQQMSNLTSLPVLVAPWSVRRELETPAMPADILTLSIPAQAPPSEIPDHVDLPFTRSGYEQVWLLLEPLTSPTYPRLPRLADFCKRLLFAAQSSVQKIFIPQPWHSRLSSTTVVTEPDELFIIYDTVSSLLADAVHIGQLETRDSVVCHAFDRRGQAVLAMWDDEAPFEGRQYVLYLAGAEQLVDIWGRSEPLSPSSGSAAVTLSPMPVFALGGETWLIQFRQGLRFDPALLSSASSSGEQDLMIFNPRPEPISGTIRLKEPEGWQIRPAQFSFAVQPGRTFAQSVRIQVPPHESAGAKQIAAQVMIDAERLYDFEAQLALQVGLADMDVWVDLVLEGDDAIVRHGVTNRSNETITLRSFADAPGCKRTNLNIVGLQPNQTIVKAHFFADAERLSGKHIRVGLQQVKGPRSQNISVLVP